MVEERRKATKKSYVAPVLTTYGDVTKLTGGAGANGAADKGGPGKTAP